MRVPMPIAARRHTLPTLATIVLAIVFLSACGDDRTTSRITLTKVVSEPATSPAGEPLPERLVVEVDDAAGQPASGVEVEVTVDRGGGSVSPSSATSGSDGRIEFEWTLGVVPVSNRVTVAAGAASLAFDTLATLGSPYVPQPFGDVNAFLTEQGIAGSTEDLAFDGGERLVMGVPGGLIALDAAGTAVSLELTGDPIVTPLGVAYDREGNLWVADSGAGALLRVSPAGVVTTELTSDGTQPLDGPNYIAVDRDDRIYLSDPCLGEVIRFDPASGVVDAVLEFDLPTEGGPNGMAFDASGDRLFLATENTGLLCGHSFVDIIDPIAGLFAVEVSDAGFGARDTIAANFALFGDGVAFDREGNLYVIFDTQRDFMLEESAIWVLPEGRGELVKLAAVQDHVLANLAFGEGDFGATTLYIALLAVPPFTPATARGAERLAVGIPGLPLLP